MYKMLSALRGLFGVGLCLASLAVPAAKPAPAAPAEAQAALSRTVLAPPAAQWLHLADALRETGEADRAILLRNHLLAAHIGELNGVAAPAPAPSVADAIASAQQRGSPAADVELAAAWEQAFNTHIRLRRAETIKELPPELAYLGPQLAPLGPGAWAMDASGLTRYFWVLYLENRSPTALPLMAFNLRADGLLMSCTPPAAPPAGDVQAGKPLVDPGEIILPGTARPFVCRAFEGPQYRETLARRLADKATTPLRLLPANLSTPEAVDKLLASIGQGQGAARAAWVQRLRNDAPANVKVASPSAKSEAAARARGQAKRASEAIPTDDEARQARQRLRVTLMIAALFATLAIGVGQIYGRLNGEDAAERWLRSAKIGLGSLVLAAIVGSPWAQRFFGHWGDGLVSSMRDSVAESDAAGRLGLGASLAQVEPFNLMLLGSLAVFLLGRLVLKAGASRAAMINLSVIALTVAGLVTIGVMVSRMLPISGEGWQRAGVFIMPIWITAMFSLAGMCTLLLHRLHFILDDDGLSWPGSVWAGLRKTLDFTGTASRGEFWGMFVFMLLASGLARGHDTKWGGIVFLGLAAPTVAVSLRRLRALTASETWGVLALLGVFIARWFIET